MYFSHHIGNPALIIGNKLRGTWTNFLILREKSRHITLASLNKSTAYRIMLKTILLCINLKCSLESANLTGLCHFDNILLGRMSQKATRFVFLFIVKHIMLHFGFSSFRIIVFIFGLIRFPESLSEHCIDYIFLLFAERIKYLLNCFFIFFRFLFRSFTFLRFGLLFFFIRRMINHDILIISNNHAIFRSVTMLHDRINECAWISSSQNKAQFINNAMYYICSCLFKLTGTNGK